MLSQPPFLSPIGEEGLAAALADAHTVTRAWLSYVTDPERQWLGPGSVELFARNHVAAVGWFTAEWARERGPRADYLPDPVPLDRLRDTRLGWLDTWSWSETEGTMRAAYPELFIGLSVDNGDDLYPAEPVQVTGRFQHHDPITRWQQARYNARRSVSKSQAKSQAWAASRDALLPLAADCYGRMVPLLNGDLDAAARLVDTGSRLHEPIPNPNIGRGVPAPSYR